MELYDAQCQQTEFNRGIEGYRYIRRTSTLFYHIDSECGKILLVHLCFIGSGKNLHTLAD